jgi:hypothetical protein
LLRLPVIGLDWIGPGPSRCNDLRRDLLAAFSIGESDGELIANDSVGVPAGRAGSAFSGAGKASSRSRALMILCRTARLTDGIIPASGCRNTTAKLA